ncbi:hypothetical protein GCM10022403_015710 [Streptomyces coacervatus]|uniref:Novel STAND NTPase 3 domain-containing protein n=1 Tax=Streptomyces coacervatus TaxID=647381 RepID=A0ABP7H2Z4_9ACTN|nr:hypothetical protein [Streptomyces coacervatus]MDF2267857.1 hypothetical protein [Streptomyces coacervatus]
MSDSFDTTVTGAQSVFAGSGTQNNYFNVEDTSIPESTRPLALDHLAWLRQRFVEPKGFQQALDVLDQTNTVLVDGDPGSGRNATARMLLYRCSEQQGELHEFLPEDTAGNPLLDRSQIDSGQRLLLDLSAKSSAEWAALHHQLPAFHDTVRKQGARLAVVLPHVVPKTIHPELGPHLVSITRPSAGVVLRRGLHRELPPDSMDPWPQELDHYLSGDPPLLDVAQLCRLIAEAHRADRTANFAMWCTTALAAVNRLPEDVAAHVVALADSRQKALLLTTAMLDESRSDAVYDVCEALLRTVRLPADERPLLEREDLSQRFREIKAAPDVNGRVRFTALDYAQAVRTHFWNHMPGLRPRLLSWVSRSVSLDSLTDRDRAALTAHLTEQILRTGQFDDLLPLIRAWIRRPGTGTRLAAGQALADGVRHPVHGREVRARLYQWSRNASLTDELAQVLIDVCAGPLGERYPDQAMVRLHHLARQTRHRPGAEQRLVELSLRDHHLRRRMLYRLADYLPQGPRDADARLFVLLTDPVALTEAGPRPLALLDQSGVRDAVTTGWSALLHAGQPSTWSRHLNTWLTAAEEPEDGRRDQLLDVLVAACRGHPSALGRLYALAVRHPVEPVLLRKIDAAQGIRSFRPSR